MSTKSIGDIGENIACSYLEDKGFGILNRNYRRKWGELDIIAIKDKVLHFFEVKSVTFDPVLSSKSHKAEDNVHGLKLRHIRRMVETFLEDTKRGMSFEFQFHVICVYMNLRTRKAKVKWIKNVVL